MNRSILGLVTTLVTVAAPAAASSDHLFRSCTPQKECRQLAEPELDRIRGGFAIKTPAGTLDISIGITRAVAVNGQLVALSQLVLPDASQIVAAARGKADAALASSNADVAKAIAAATGGIGTPRVSGTTPPQSVAAPASTGLGDASLPATNAVIVQNGAGNVTILSGSSNLPVLPTIIQNTLNDQVISSATLLNINTSSLSAFRSLALGDLLNSVRFFSGR